MGTWISKWKNRDYQGRRWWRGYGKGVDGFIDARIDDSFIVGWSCHFSWGKFCVMQMWRVNLICGRPNVPEIVLSKRDNKGIISAEADLHFTVSMMLHWVIQAIVSFNFRRQVASLKKITFSSLSKTKQRFVIKIR